MYMVTNDEDADPAKGYLARGDMSDLQVWMIETLLNKDPDVSPYMALVALTTISGLVSLGLPITEAVLKSVVLQAEDVTEKVRSELDEQDKEADSGE